MAHARGVLEVLGEGEDLSEGERQAGELLTQVADQDVKIDEEGRFHLRHGVTKDRVISVTDLEMRHGRKSKHRCFDGYKFHVSEDPETEPITGVAMGWASEHDAESLPQMVDDDTEVVIGDGVYGTADMRAKMDAEGIQVVAPQRPAGRKGMFTKADFRIDLNQATCRCPAGATASPAYRRKDGALKGFRFSRADCERCDLKVQCTRSPYRIVNLHSQEKHLLTAREFQGTEDFRALYRLRPTVERKIAEMVRHGMRRARYMGMRRGDLQALFTAAVVNLKRNHVPDSHRSPPGGPVAGPRGGVAEGTRIVTPKAGRVTPLCGLR